MINKDSCKLIVHKTGVMYLMDTVDEKVQIESLKTILKKIQEKRNIKIDNLERKDRIMGYKAKILLID